LSLETWGGWVDTLKIIPSKNTLVEATWGRRIKKRKGIKKVPIL